jgi:CheY-like chemotaxis protein
VRADLGNREAAEREARAQATANAARLLELERELGAARGELGRLHEERARVLAAVDDAGTEPVAMIRALREQAAVLDARVRTLADERAMVVERAAAERTALDAKLAAAEYERATAETQRAEQTSRIAALERDLMRSEEMLSSARRQLDAAVERVRAHASVDRAPTTVAPVAAVPPEPVVAPIAAAAAVPPPASTPAGATPSLPRIEVLSPPPAPVVEYGGHRILEADPLVRARVAAALAAEGPADSASPLFVVNLLSALPDRLGELRDPTGSALVAYVAAAGRSRILGPLRCFTAPPEPEVMLAAIGKLGKQRRLISLSEDVDGLIPLKAALSKSGHSVSMACDPKQALDLLGMLTPDAVLVDLRTAPESAATFLEALALENGRTPAFLVCGDDPGVTLRRALEPLLRPLPLDASQLAKVCQIVLTPPTPEATVRNAQSSVVRPLDRKAPATPATRKPVPRRVLTKRR